MFRKKEELSKIFKETQIEVMKLLGHGQGLLKCLKRHHEYSFVHSVNVSALSTHIAIYLGLRNDQLSMVALGALLHDIGKIRIPVEILNKPTSLTEQEYKIIQLHPLYGAELLAKYNLPLPVSTIVLQHHERTNGSGYPLHQTIDKTYPLAQIVAVADVFSALVEKRPYRDAMSAQAAIEIIKDGRHQFFAPKVITALEKVIQRNLIGAPLPTPT